MQREVVYIGGGFIGLSGAAHYARKGIRTTVVDTNAAVVTAINTGTCPVPGLESHMGFRLGPLVTAGLLRAVSRLEDAVGGHGAPEPAPRIDAVCVALPTEKHGHRDLNPLRNWWNVFTASPCCLAVDHVVIESTVVHGTMDAMLRSPGLFPGGLAVAPRRDWFDDQKHPLPSVTRLLGVARPGPWPVESLVREVSPQLVLGGYREVELAKGLENTLLYLPVVMAMEAAVEHPDVDMNAVLRLVGTHFARPTYHVNAGVGGYCVPVAHQYLNPTAMGRHARDAERHARDVAYQRAMAAWAPASVLLVGWAYKANTHLTTGAPAVRWAQALTASGVPVCTYDTHVSLARQRMECDAVREWSPMTPADLVVLMASHTDTIDRPQLVHDLIQGARVVLDTTGGWEEHRALIERQGVAYRRLWGAHWDAPLVPRE